MTVMFVEHDMDVVYDISDWVVVMAEGRIIAEGPPDVIGTNHGGDRRLPRRAPRCAADRARRRPGSLAEAEAAIAAEEPRWSADDDGGRAHEPTGASASAAAGGHGRARARRRRRPPTVATGAWPPFDGPVLDASEVVAGYVPEVNILNGCYLTLSDRELVGIIGPNGAGKSTLLKALFGLIPIRAGTVTLPRRRASPGVKAHDLVARGVGYVPQNNNVFPRLTVEENLEMGLYHDRKRLRRALRRRVRAVPAARRAPQAAGRIAVGRRAPDGGHGSGADDGPVGAAARRAVGRPVAAVPGRGVHPLPADQRGPASRSSWSSRTPAAACRSATGATCSTRAPTPTPAPASELLTDPKVIELYLGTLAKAR